MLHSLTKRGSEMTHDEMEQTNQKLDKIMKLEELDKGEYLNNLIKLAQECGASCAMDHSTTESECQSLVDNIHKRLEIAAVINMCKASAKNYKIALIATIIALLSMLAAWLAVWCK